MNTVKSVTQVINVEVKIKYTKVQKEKSLFNFAAHVSFGIYSRCSLARLQKLGPGVTAVITDHCRQRMPTMDTETEEDRGRALEATPRDPSCRTRIFNADTYGGKYNSLGQHYRRLETLPCQHISCHQEDRRT